MEAFTLRLRFRIFFQKKRKRRKNSTRFQKVARIIQGHDLYFTRARKNGKNNFLLSFLGRKKEATLG